MVGLTPPPHRAWTDNDGKPIYFDSIDNSAYIMGKAEHSARSSWIYTTARTLLALAPTLATIRRIPTSTSPGSTCTKDTWLGPKQDLGGIGSIYNLTMDPFEKYDMTFNGAVSTRRPQDVMRAMTMAGVFRRSSQ